MKPKETFSTSFMPFGGDISERSYVPT